VFLLPSRQTFLKTTSEAKVLVLFDMSDSMGVSDEQPPEPGSKRKMLTRQDKVLTFLGDARANFLPELEKKNPVTVYRLGRRLHEQFLVFADGRNWTRAEREKPDRDSRGRIILPKPAPLPEAYWAAFLSPAAAIKFPNGFAAEDKTRSED